MQDPLIMIGAPMILIGLVAVLAAAILSLVAAASNRAEQPSLPASRVGSTKSKSESGVPHQKR